MFAYIRRRTVAFEISIQVSADATILTWQAGTVVYICSEKNHCVIYCKDKEEGWSALGQFESSLQLDMPCFIVKSSQEDWSCKGARFLLES